MSVSLIAWNSRNGVSFARGSRTVVEGTERFYLVVVPCVLSTGQGWWWFSAELRWPRHFERIDVAEPWRKYR